MKNKIHSLLFSKTSIDTAVSMVGLVITAGVGMLFTILTARVLSPVGFGVFSALNAIVTIFASMGDFGISSALVNFLPKSENNRSSVISIAFWFQLAVAIILGLGLSSVSFFHGWLVPGSSQQDFYLIGLLTAIYVLQGLSVGIFSAEKKFLLSSFVQSSDSVLKMTFAAIFALTRTLSIPLALFANVLSSLFSVAFGLSKEFKEVKPIFPKKEAVEIFKFARWIALSRIFSVSVSRIDVLLLNLLAGSYAAGIFAAASRITLLFALLVGSLGSVIAPRFSAFKLRNDILIYLKKVSLLVAAICVVMLASIVVAKPLVLSVFGEKYAPAIPIFQYLTIAMIPFLLNVITTQPLIYSFNKPNFFAFTTILQVVVIVGLDLILIPRFSAAAPAVSLGVANTLVLVLSTIKLRQEMAKIS